MIETEASGQKIFSDPQPLIGYGNFGATTPPTRNDDELLGYSINSIWYKASIPYRLWICTDNTEGAAIWREIPLIGYRNTGTIFDSFTTLTTATTALETLYSGTIPGFLLFENGDEARVSYRGTFATNSNDKSLLIEIDGNSIFDTGALTKNGGHWRIEVQMMRTASDTLGVSVFYEDALTTLSEYISQGSLDLGADFEVALQATTGTAAGDVSVHTIKAFMLPAAPVGEDTLTFLGGGLEFLGETVTFAP